MSKAAQVAAELEAAFFRCAPQARKKRTSEAEWTGALAKFQAQAREIRRRHALGVIGRARAAFLLQPRLIAAGIPPDVVRKLVFSLVLNSFS